MHFSPVSGPDMVLNQVSGCFRFKPVMEQNIWSDPLQFPAVNRFFPPYLNTKIYRVPLQSQYEENVCDGNFRASLVTDACVPFSR